MTSQVGALYCLVEYNQWNKYCSRQNTFQPLKYYILAIPTNAKSICLFLYRCHPPKNSLEKYIFNIFQSNSVYRAFERFTITIIKPLSTLKMKTGCIMCYLCIRLLTMRSLTYCTLYLLHESVYIIVV